MNGSAGLDPAVAIFMYARTDPLAGLIERLRPLRPKRLYLLADGPSPRKPGDHESCRKVRELAEAAITWPCEFTKVYAETNLGLQARLESGLDHVFAREAFAVVLEDDCWPEAQFLPFCQAMEECFRASEKVAVISGSCFLPRRTVMSSDFYFTRYAHCWGWATWASRWQEYRQSGWHWPPQGYRSFFPDASPQEQAYWNRIFSRMEEGRFQSWAYGWQAHLWSRELLTVCPSQNLVVNVGFGASSTHTRDADIQTGVERTGSLDSFHRSPPEIRADPDLDRSLFQNHFVRMAGRRGLWQKLADRVSALRGRR